MVISKKIVLPIVVMLIAAVAVWVIYNNPPEAKRQRPNNAAVLSVETQLLQPEKFQITLDSYGVVTPRTQSSLMSQVAGQIVFVDDAFRTGGFFQKGDLLLAIDDSDYLAEVNIAKANLITAQQSLAEEMARSEQAKIDWQRLGGKQKPSDLVLRIPQQESAQANLISAKAQLTKAELSLKRTKIIAPYSGRVVTQNVDIGTVVSNNTELASIYATDYLEVRLAINNNDLGFVDLPETNIDNSLATPPINVTFTSDLIGQQTWTGKIIRTESSIDSASRQLYVVAQIDDPFNQAIERGVSIKIGEYLTAEIEGQTIDNAIVIPVTAIYQGSYVYIEQDGVLLRKEVEVAWQNDSQALIKSGLESGQALVVTPLGQVSSGTAVSVINNASHSQKQSKGAGKKRDPNSRPERPNSERGANRPPRKEG
ncbi:efflux RND transporter periplasmic adaptor subunit [Aliiglaciecola sp. 3_MG-2023]|uniref:efflux RND transporter periplasmic adaptor subunit n=1 Tax=Aliiglaciecola sp. 3_MG-2023 TaxID=3062644 RepID=UPI0026E3FBAD|nr:efflux RND transporter periplasmic adaptor subunit [Aliiglaciecola sp. 3_MG-2023]MDO6693091.1 efflux RND transporter periplasmic adaptor subunit [Aliiglaciecola sp. 3_MG-2023]